MILVLGISLRINSPSPDPATCAVQSGPPRWTTLAIGPLATEDHGGDAIVVGSTTESASGTRRA